MRWILLAGFALFSCQPKPTPASPDAPPSSVTAGKCPHSKFLEVDGGSMYDTTATSIHLHIPEIVPDARYRLMSDNRAMDKEGNFDAEGRASFWLDGFGEYFLEIKAPGREPLMLESIRWKGGTRYSVEICLAKGMELQRYKYLGEDKNHMGVMEKL